MAYTFERDGTWGRYDDGVDSSDFDSTLKRLGFAVSRDFEYALGTATVFSRSETKIKWPYAFVCKLSLGSHGHYYTVWIKDLPTVFKFLREIDASRRDGIQALINYLSGDTLFEEAMRAIHRRDPDV